MLKSTKKMNHIRHAVDNRIGIKTEDQILKLWLMAYFFKIKERKKN